jgi:AraC-like DNA-binding protein
MKPAYKPVPHEESKLFKIERQKSNKEFDYPWHYHPEFELTFIVSSQGMRYVGNHMENFFDDDFILLGSNLPHCWINSSEQVKPADAVVIYFNAEFIQWLREAEFESIGQLFERSNRGVKFSKETALQIKPRLSQLFKANYFEKFIMLMQILHELSVANQYHLLCPLGFSYELNLTNNERINKVYQYIRKNYQQKITIANVAAQVNMSEEYFSRFFSKIMMKSFVTFLNEYKINRACKMLIETDKQVSEVCYVSGFESIPFFYRQFKKFKNCQPKTYRLNYQRISAESIG